MGVRDVATLLVDAATLAQNPNNFGDTRSGGLAGPIGLFIIVLLAIATVLLIRNMNSRLRRLPDRFPSQGNDDRPPPGGDQRPSGTPEGP